MNHDEQLLALQYGVFALQTLNLFVTVFKMMIEEIRKTEEKKTL